MIWSEQTDPTTSWTDKSDTVNVHHVGEVMGMLLCFTYSEIMYYDGETTWTPITDNSTTWTVV